MATLLKGTAFLTGAASGESIYDLSTSEEHILILLY
jgi:hypothetical protein